MEKRNEKMPLEKITLDDLFTSQKERDIKDKEVIQYIPIKDISNFPNHPYKVIDDKEMDEMVESIKNCGIIHPVIVRPKGNRI